MGCCMKNKKNVRINNNISLNSNLNYHTNYYSYNNQNNINKLSKNNLLKILNFLQFKELREVGKINRLFNYLTKDDRILIKFFKKKEELIYQKSIQQNNTKSTKFTKDVDLSIVQNIIDGLN